ncbi:MAG: hypothetical protein H6Q74_2290 [Firmicutes bacterium]|nr:hypothetical protein [Bacillota bacterium]
MDIDSTSTWNVSADSTVTSLTNSGGTVNLLYSDGTYYTLTDTGNLSGSGTFKMNVDLSDTSLLNTITVDGTASGTYAIYFTGQNAAYLATNSLTSPIKVLSTGTSTATITGGGDFGAYRWSIAAGSTLSSSYSSSDYYLYNTYTPSTPAYAAIDTTASNVAAWYGEMNEIANHMNELRVASKYNDDFWSRTYSNKFTVKPNGGKSFTEVMSGVEVGKDNASFFDGGKKVTGFLVGAGKADNSFSTGGSGSVDSYYGAAYSSWIKNDGSYFDLIGKYNSFSNDFSATLLGGEITDTASYHSNSFGLSAQIGKRLEKGNGVFIDPQASVTVLRSNSADYTSTNGLAVSLPANTSMQFKLGGTFGKKTTDSNGDSRQVYGKLAWVQNSSSDSKTIVDEASFDSNLKGSQVVTGIGFIQEVGSHEIYINVEKSWGNDLNYYGGNLGYRWKF